MKKILILTISFLILGIGNGLAISNTIVDSHSVEFVIDSAGVTSDLAIADSNSVRIFAIHEPENLIVKVPKVKQNFKKNKPFHKSSKTSKGYSNVAYNRTQHK